MDLDTQWAGLDAGLCTRKQEGAFIYSPISDNAWHPVSPMADFALTFGTFALAMAAPVAFVVWMLS